MAPDDDHAPLGLGCDDDQDGDDADLKGLDQLLNLSAKKKPAASKGGKGGQGAPKRKTQRSSTKTGKRTDLWLSSFW